MDKKQRDWDNIRESSWANTRAHQHSAKAETARERQTVTTAERETEQSPRKEKNRGEGGRHTARVSVSVQNEDF